MGKKQRLLKMGILGLCLSIGFGNLLTKDAHAVNNPSVSIAISSTVDLEILPTANGTVSSKSADLIVKTEKTAGFRVMINSSSTNLANKLHPEQTMRTISSKTVLKSFPKNAWGVYLGANSPTQDSTFSPVSTAATEFVQNEVANASGTYKLAIGMKVDTTLPAGMYQNELIVSVVAEAAEVTNLAEATYMQEVTPEICTNSDLEVTQNLIDKRDGKTYRVAKLKDGNCWMQDNLAFTLDRGDVLTPEDSDVSEDWTSPNDFWDVSGRMYYTWDVLTTGGERSENNIAQDSLCARGWKLTSAGDYDGLIGAYNVPSNSDIIMTQPPLYFTRVGYYWNGAVHGAGNYGDYWTSGKGSDDYRVYLMLRYLGANSSENGVFRHQILLHNRGLSARCLVRSASS